MNIFDNFLEKNRNTNPIQNPIRYQFSPHYNGACLGKKGKIYHKRGKFLKGILNPKIEGYAVPNVYEEPIGFYFDGYAASFTKSEAVAMNHYRNARKASGKLRNKWDKIIKEQDYIYSLSKSISSNTELPESLNENFIPREHQKVAIQFGELTNGKFVICDQQRTGKSYSALLYILSQKWDKCLIVSPSKVVSIWGNMIQNICSENINILGSGDELQNGFNIVSYDTLHTILDLNCDIAVCDEAHFFLENDARRSKAVHRIDAEKKIALTGTPIMNSVNDMLNILLWVNKEIFQEMKELVESYIGEDAYTQSQLLSRELKRRCMLLRETHQVSDSIEPYINFIELNLNIDNPKNLKEVGKAKVNYVVEYCKSFENKILIACYHKETANMIRMRLGNKAVIITGETPERERQDAEHAFKNDAQYLIGTMCLAEGLDFSHCDHLLIVEESSYSMRTDQLRERCNRVGKQTETTIDIIIAKGTQDERLYDIYNHKYSLQRALRDA